MATELGQAYVQIVPSAKGISGAISKQIDPEATSAGKSAGSKLGSALKVGLLAAAATAGVAMGKIISSSISEGANLQQSLGGTEAVFGDFAGNIQSTAKDAYKNMGLSASDYMATANKMGSLFQGSGVDQQKSVDMTSEAMQRAADVASVMGLDTSAAMESIAGAAKGNFTMMDNLGVAMNATTLEAYALEKGMNFDWNTASQAEKSELAMKMFMDRTSQYAGNFAKESAETFSGSFASMKASFSNFLGNLSLGQDIGPSLQALAETVSTFLFDNFIPMVGNILSALPGAIGTILRAGLKEVFSQLGVDIDVDSIFNKFKAAFEPLELIMSDLEVIFQALGGIVQDFFSAIVGGDSAGATGIFYSIADGVESLLTWISEGTLQVAQFMDNFSDTSAFQSFLDFAQTIGDTLGTVFTTLGPIVQNTLGTVLEQIPGLFETVVSSVTPIIQMIGDAISKLDFSGIQTFISAVVPAIQNAFTTMMGIVSPAIDQVVNSFVSLWNAAQPFITTLSGALMPVLQVVGAFLGGVFKGILTGVSFAFDAIKVAIDLLSPVVSFLVGVFQQIAPVLTTVAEWVGTVIGMFTSLGGSGNSLKTILQSAWTNIKTAISTAKNVISIAINGIKSVFTSLSGAGNVLKGALSGIWNGIKSVISAAGSAIKSVLSSVGSGFSAMGDVFSSVGSKISGIIDGVKNVINGLKNIDISGAGSAIMEGFLGGLKSAWGSVKDFVGGIGSWIKEHKGPLSYDKKLLIPAGNAIMDSLNSGLIDRFKTVKSTISGVAGKLQSIISNGVDTSSLFEKSWNPQAELSYSTVASESHNNNVSLSQDKYSRILELMEKLSDKYIIVENSLDGKVFSKAVVKPIYEELNKLDNNKARKRGER